MNTKIEEFSFEYKMLQFKLLMELHVVIEKIHKLKERLRIVDKTRKLAGSQRAREKLDQIQKEFKEFEKKRHDLRLSIKANLDYFLISSEIEELELLIKNNEKSKKKFKIDEKTFKTLDLEYKFRLNDANSKLQEFRDFATAFSTQLKDNLSEEEKKREVLWDQRWKDFSIKRKSYKKQLEPIEFAKKLMFDVLKFIKSQILSIKVD